MRKSFFSISGGLRELIEKGENFQTPAKLPIKSEFRPLNIDYLLKESNVILDEKEGFSFFGATLSNLEGYLNFCFDTINRAETNDIRRKPTGIGQKFKTSQT